MLEECGGERRWPALEVLESWQMLQTLLDGKEAAAAASAPKPTGRLLQLPIIF